MDLLQDLFSNRLFVRSFWSIITILISVFCYNVIIFVIDSSARRGKLKIFSSKKGLTYFKMLKSIIRYILILITVLIILQIFGINITSMLAGVGIIGIIIGFAIQDALKDIIKGFDIISDNYYQVGDVIKFGEITGKVTAIGLKTTKVEDIYTLNKVSISNRNIEQVEVVSNLINIDIPMSYDISIDKAEKIIDEIVLDIKKQEHINNCEYRGVNDFAESSIKYQIKVYCNPIHKVQIRRDSLRCIMLILNKHNISVPYNQMDIHNK